MKIARYGRNPGWAVVAIVAIVYGVAVAFLQGDGAGTGWVVIGAYAVGVLFIALMVVPFIVWVTRQRA